MSALDNNMKLWVAIETNIKNKKHTIPTDTKDNLLQLGHFIKTNTLKYGNKISDKLLDSFVYTNLQIAEGLLSAIKLQPAKEDAIVLVKSAFNLAQSRDNNDLEELTKAIHENLNIWVLIKSKVNNSTYNFPKDVVDNLTKLSKFTTQKTMELCEDINDKTIKTLINTNLQIAEGLLEGYGLSETEKDSLSLLISAINLSGAKDDKNPEELVKALNENLNLWVSIKSLVSKNSHPLSSDIKKNLIRLADYTAQKTFETGSNLNDINHKAVDSLININLEISEGMLQKISA